MNKLKQGKEEIKDKCIQCAIECTPPNVFVIFPRKSLTGRVWYRKNRLDVPKPFTRRALHIFLHECAHLILHRDSYKKKYIQEYEAECWAFQKMREYNIPVPRKSLSNAKSYIRYKIGQAQKRGLKKVDTKIKHWSKEK